MAKRSKTRIHLAQNNYGKSRVRMVKVSRVGRLHTVREFSVDIALEGDFDAIHTKGDNRNCLPTDTMKNTVYALGKSHPIDSIETFATRLGKHFLGQSRVIEQARVRIAETPWKRVWARGREHPHCFLKGSAERQACEIVCGRRDNPSIVGSLEDLIVLKSTDSAFAGYLKDEFTTLPEADDRIMATSLTARWTFARKANYTATRENIRRTLIEVFAAHKSKSVQHTLYAMGEAALKVSREISSIRLSMPNKHCLLINLRPFGMDNPNEIFVPTDEPHGLIEATVTRG